MGRAEAKANRVAMLTEARLSVGFSPVDAANLLGLRSAGEYLKLELGHKLTRARAEEVVRAFRAAGSQIASRNRRVRGSSRVGEKTRRPPPTGTSAVVELYDCAPLEARITTFGCAANRERARFALEAQPPSLRSAISHEMAAALSGVEACLSCPGVLALAAGARPNELEVVYAPEDPAKRRAALDALGVVKKRRRGNRTKKTLAELLAEERGAE